MNRREYNRRLTAMDKMIQVKKDLKTLLPEIEQDKYGIMILHLYRYHRNKREYYSRLARQKKYILKPLTPSEIVLLDYLLKNKINPQTLYRWYRISMLPEDIQTDLRSNKIKSCALAIRISTNRLRQRNSNAGLLMLEEIKQVVSSL